MNRRKGEAIRYLLQNEIEMEEGEEMKKVLTIVICAVALLVLCSFTAATAAQVTLRFSDWHLTEDVWNKSLNEAMAIFHKQHPNI